MEPDLSDPAEMTRAMMYDPPLHRRIINTKILVVGAGNQHMYGRLGHGRRLWWGR